MIHCPNCGMENRDGAKFCKSCRAPLPSSPYVQVSQAPQQPHQPSYQEPQQPYQPLPQVPSYQQPPDSPKSKKPLIIGVAGALLLCCVCVVAVVLLATYTDILSFLPFLGPKWAASKIMPADTGFFASINPGVEDLAGYQHLAEIYSDIPQVEDAIEELEDALEDELGITFEEDIKPWLGPELAFAITNLEDTLDGENPIVVMAAATRDREASDAFLEEIREYLEDEDYDVEEETYKDVTYYVEEDTPMAFGTVGNYVILATDVDAIEDVIDTSKGDADPLSENESYTELVDALPEDAVAHVFYDMRNVMDIMLEETDFELPEETTEQFEAFKTFGMALSLDTEGVQLDFIVTFDPDELSPEMLENFEAGASAGDILQRIPDDALGFTSGQNLATGWKNLLANLQENPDFEEQLEDLEDELGLKVDEELLSWATGEHALAVIELGEAVDAVPVGAFAVFEVDDQTAAEGALEDIAEAIEEGAYMEFKEEEIGGVEMQVLVDEYMEEILLGYGFTDQYLVIGFLEGGLEAAVDDSIEPIANDEMFKSVIAHLPSSNRGYFYSNVEVIWQLIYENVSDYDKEYYDDEVTPFVEPIKAVGVAGSVTDPQEGFSRGTLFIYIP